MGTIAEAQAQIDKILMGAVGAAHLAASQHFQEIEPTVVQRVVAFWPGPDRPDIHIYATGTSKASIYSETAISPFPRLTVGVRAPYAMYTREGYTRKGQGTAISWGLRGQQDYLTTPAVEAVTESLPALQKRFARLAGAT